MKHLENSVMLDALKKVQEVQVDITKAGLSAWIQANTSESVMEDESRIYFELIVFDDSSIVQKFEFDAFDTKEHIDAKVAMAQAYSKTL